MSCKNKQSLERCERISIKEFLFCRTHAKSKIIRWWITENPYIKQGLIRIQSLWRGYAIRYRIRLAGPGCLQRSICHNDEDSITCESKDTVHPFDYFSICQDDKIWWFDQKSMIEWSKTSIDIKNPFTRRVLDPSDCKRLRNLAYIRKKKKLPTVDSATDPEVRWLRIVQILSECGFDSVVHHQHFMNMNYRDIRVFIQSLLTDTKSWMYNKIGNKDPYDLFSKRAKYNTWLRCMYITIKTYDNVSDISKDISGVLLACMNDIRDPTEFAFFILTAFSKTDAAAGWL